MRRGEGEERPTYEVHDDAPDARALLVPAVDRLSELPMQLLVHPVDGHQAAEHLVHDASCHHRRLAQLVRQLRVQRFRLYT